LASLFNLGEKNNSVNQRIWINISLLVIIVVLSVIIFFNKNEIEDELLPLSSINQKSIININVQRKNLDNLSFSKSDGVWNMITPLQFQANRARIESILKILETKSYNQFNLDEVDIAQFALRNPAVILELNENKFSFGTNNPINQKRYILFNKKIHMIDDFHFFQLTTNAAYFAETKLLPDKMNIISIRFPEYTIRLNNGKWQASIPEYDEKKVKQIINKWKEIIAISASKYEKQEGQKTITINSLSGQEINFTIVATAPYLILGREDIGIQYNMSMDDAKQMF
jgi:hypothetical protein